MIYNRSKKDYYEQKESKILVFLHYNFLGKILLNIINKKTVSKIINLYMSSFFSKWMIKKTIKNNNINMDDYIEEKYNNFNQFFNRKIKKDARPISNNKKLLLSPCDAKLSVYNIDSDRVIKIKNIDYTIESLIKDKDIANEYKDGYCLVFRLCVEDYHSYYFIDDGEVLEHKEIKGILNSVRPISLKNKKVFAENNREWALLKTKTFDNIIYMEVGALGVGKIINKKINRFKRGTEKGYFMFGGSTIVLLVKKDLIKIDDDIIREMKLDNEIQVKLFEPIGVKIDNKGKD